MTASDKNMDALDTLLAQSGADPASLPNDTFMALMIEGALAHQPLPQIVTPSLWQQAKAFVGGWQGMGGLVAATCVGFWIGISPPEGLSLQLDTVLNSGLNSGLSLGQNLDLNTDTYVTLLDDSIEDTSLFGFGWDVEEG